jgi:hypothetical protein
LQQHFLDNIPKKFSGAEVAFRFAIVAYNFMSLFRQLVAQLPYRSCVSNALQ